MSVVRPRRLLGRLAVVWILLLFLFNLYLICFPFLLLLILLLCTHPDILLVLQFVLSLLPAVLLLLPVKVLVGSSPGQDCPKPLCGQDRLCRPLWQYGT